MLLQLWTQILVNSLRDVWHQFLGFLPNLIGAFVVFFIGLLVATGLEKLAERVVYYLKIDTLLKKAGVEPYFKRMRVRLNTGHFVGRVVFWFLVIAFLLASADILGFSSLSIFLNSVLAYIPQVFIAALILVATLYVAHFLRGLVLASVLSTGHKSAAKAVSMIAWWGVIVFGFLTALTQLGVVLDIITTLVTGFIAMLALAGGLAFGLGGRDTAARLLRRMEDSMTGE